VDVVGTRNRCFIRKLRSGDGRGPRILKVSRTLQLSRSAEEFGELRFVSLGLLPFFVGEKDACVERGLWSLADRLLTT